MGNCPRSFCYGVYYPWWIADFAEVCHSGVFSFFIGDCGYYGVADEGAEEGEGLAIRKRKI